jgi:hypothetical protein
VSEQAIGVAKRGGTAGAGGDRYNFEGDVVLQQGLALLPSLRAANDGATLPALTRESGAQPPANASPDAGAAVVSTLTTQASLT